MSSDREKKAIARHKTAIKRQSFSLPVKCMLRDGLLHSDRTFFDYGCGHGQDLAMLSGMSIQAAGWDPVHRPDSDRQPADVVNLGYVINVIEDPRERQQVIRKAWELCKTRIEKVMSGDWIVKVETVGHLIGGGKRRFLYLLLR
jgi:DNA phosphorothioation-associated putative methyltransferase